MEFGDDEETTGGDPTRRRPDRRKKYRRTQEDPNVHKFPCPLGCPRRFTTYRGSIAHVRFCKNLNVADADPTPEDQVLDQGQDDDPFPPDPVATEDPIPPSSVDPSSSSQIVPLDVIDDVDEIDLDDRSHYEQDNLLVVPDPEILLNVLQPPSHSMDSPSANPTPPIAANPVSRARHSPIPSLDHGSRISLLSDPSLGDLAKARLVSMLDHVGAPHYLFREILGWLGQLCTTGLVSITQPKLFPTNTKRESLMKRIRDRFPVPKVQKLFVLLEDGKLGPIPNIDGLDPNDEYASLNRPREHDRKSYTRIRSMTAGKSTSKLKQHRTLPLRMLQQLSIKGCLSIGMIFWNNCLTC
jgi:hypothetical protein